MAFAQNLPAASVDLHIEAQISGPSPVPPGGSAVLTVTVHNFGPDDAALTHVLTRDSSLYGGNAYTLTPSAPDACPTELWEPDPPTTPPNSYLRSETGSLPSGESLRCTYLLTALPQPSHSRTIRLWAWDYSGAADEVDGSDNVTEVQVVFGSAVVPRTIPATGTLTLLALALGIGAVAAVRRR